MRFNTRIPMGLRVYYIQELDAFKKALANRKLQVAWRHLERAHILGQSYPFEHTEVHWMMLKFGVSIKNWHEVLGQIPRLLVGGVKSFVGKIPIGNTGGADVPPLRPMEIPDDLKIILERFS